MEHINVNNVINLTPHDITLINNGEKHIFKASGLVARCEEKRNVISYINKIPVYSKTFGSIVDMPEEKENTIYIVSSIIAQALKGIRNDVYVVNDTVRNNDGVIIHCTSLAKI